MHNEFRERLIAGFVAFPVLALLVLQAWAGYNDAQASKDLRRMESEQQELEARRAANAAAGREPWDNNGGRA